MSDIRWFIDQNLVEADAVRQIENTASIPVVKAVAVMPDVHYGRGSTVGTVVALEDAVIPAAVGVDIGCGMIAVRTSFLPADVVTKAKDIRTGIERRIPMGIGQRGMNTRIALTATARRIEYLEHLEYELFNEQNYMMKRHKDWRYQLGSLGGGNHFIEVCVGHPIEEGFYSPQNDAQGEVWVTLHSGSRGVGNKVGTFHTQVAKGIARKMHFDSYLPDPDLAWLVRGTPEYSLYLNEMHWCQEYARLNREEMMDRVMTELTHMVGERQSDGILINGPGQVELERINCHHNFMSRENFSGKNLIIIRKGAIEARRGMKAMIPGSMGTASYIVEGLGNEGAFNSAPHGAGRRMSRTQARASLSLASLQSHMEARGIESNVREAIVDEHPDSYKDIEAVIQAASILVRPTTVLNQIINMKGD